MTTHACFYDEFARSICERAGKEEPLSIADERQLIARAQSGGADGQIAARRLVQSHQRWVIKVSKPYHASARYANLQFADLIQAGNMGLFNAIKEFDLTQSVRLTTFSFRPISWAIRDLVAEQNSGLTRVPVGVGRNLVSLRKLQRELDMSGTYMTEPEMATKLGWTLNYLKVLLDLARQPVSLSAPVEEDGTEFGSRLSVADETATAGDGVDYDRFRTLLRKALSKLDARESAIVCAQFLKIIGRDGESHEQLSQRFHVSRTRIGQIYLRAKEKLQSDPDLAELGLAFA